MQSAKAFKEPIVARYIETVERKLFDRWRMTDPTDTQGREVIYLQCLGLEEFGKFVRNVIIDGENAQKELNSKLESELTGNNS